MLTTSLTAERRWLIASCTICTLLAVPTTAMERFPRPSLVQLIARADAAVTGKIVELQKGTIVLQLEQVQRVGATVVRLGEDIADELEVGQSLEIQRSRPACSARRHEYAVGQRWIVLVKKDERGRFDSVCGCDAESLVVGDDVLCGFTVPNPRAEFFGWPPDPRLKLVDLQAAIADFPQMFRVAVYRNLPPELAQPGTRPNDPQVTLIGTPREQQAFAKRSRAHKLLLELAGK